ncbi:calcium/sodium antiporter [Rhodobacterales bacterium HKCCE3408]|nr:calcium/sodium antiporter [Rhodobacterales bacterium HKCCE3408]
MTAHFLYAGLGLLILLLAGDVLVRGAVNLSLRLGIPALIVSLTVVAFGTSAPELLISVRAVLEGFPGLALGNVVGSNTANVLLVLGIPAIISCIYPPESDTRRSYLFMMAASFLFVGLAMTGIIAFWQGLILIAALAFILFDQGREAMSHAADNAAEETLEEADPEMPWWKIALFVGLGLIGLPVGADLLVDSSIVIARTFGVSETAIGLTLVAVGTSLPELATTVMAAIRRHSEVAIGNVIGSNIFNLLAIIGITAIIGPIPVDPNFLTFDLWVMLAASAILGPFVFLRWRMGRRVGLALTALYAIYVWMILHSGTVVA